VFGDILVWVATFLGLVPWDKVFGRKKDFQEQLAEFSDAPVNNDNVDTHGRFGSVGPDLSDHFGIEDETTERVYGPWGVVPTNVSPSVTPLMPSCWPTPKASVTATNAVSEGDFDTHLKRMRDR